MANTSKVYKDLLEQNVRSNEQLVQSMKDHSEVLKGIGANLETLNKNTSKINDDFHDDMKIVKEYYIKNIEELKLWVKTLGILLIIAIGGASVLKIAGII